VSYHAHREKKLLDENNTVRRYCGQQKWYVHRHWKRCRRGLGVSVTWVDLEVGGDTVCVDNDLKDVGELVSLVVSRRRLFRLHAVQYRRHAAATALLHRQRHSTHMYHCSPALTRKLCRSGADILCGRPPDFWPFEHWHPGYLLVQTFKLSNQFWFLYPFSFSSSKPVWDWRTDRHTDTQTHRQTDGQDS